jgi:hypothetical protein
MTQAQVLYSLLTGQVSTDLVAGDDVNADAVNLAVAQGGPGCYVFFTNNDVGIIRGYSFAPVADLVAINTAVSGRTFPNILPQGETGLPAIVYRLADARPVNDFDGPAQMDMLTLDLWIYAKTRKQAELIAGIVRNGIDGFASRRLQYVWYFNDFFRL